MALPNRPAPTALRRNCARRVRAADAGFYVHEGATAAEKRKRAQVTARWLVDTFGRDVLNCKCFVGGGRVASRAAAHPPPPPPLPWI
eukprot:365086-Chlamydomonas_euryale.AAC.15